MNGFAGSIDMCRQKFVQFDIQQTLTEVTQPIEYCSSSAYVKVCAGYACPKRVCSWFELTVLARVLTPFLFINFAFLRICAHIFRSVLSSCGTISLIRSNSIRRYCLYVQITLCSNLTVTLLTYIIIVSKVKWLSNTVLNVFYSFEPIISTCYVFIYIN